MYHIEDTVSAIKEVQRLLGVNQTGVYDADTKSAVSEIQRNYSLNNSEIVDYETFKFIVEAHRNKERKILKTDFLFSADLPYKESDMGENIALINSTLIPVLEEYRYDGLFPSGKYLGISTINAANFLREIFRIQISDEIDAEFINRLMDEMNALEIKRKYG